jgi:hypothetical protein
MMTEKNTCCKSFTLSCSLNFSTDAHAVSVKAYQNLLTALSNLYWLQRHEPLNVNLQYPETRKAFKYGIGEFRSIYTAYKKQRGAV